MRLSRPFSILIAGLFCASASFADDVCELRPDLCGGPVKAKKAKRGTSYKNETMREADELEREIILERQERANNNRTQHKRDSSPLGEAPNTEPPAKPLGFSQIQKAPRSHQSMRDFGRKRPRKLDRKTENVFDAYMNSNSHNPALSARLPSSQSAFQPAKKNGFAPAPAYTNRPDPVVSGGGFNNGQGPHPENGGFSSKPVTLESDAPASTSTGGDTGPVPNAETPQDGAAPSPAGPLH